MQNILQTTKTLNEVILRMKKLKKFISSFLKFFHLGDNYFLTVTPFKNQK